LIRRARRSSTRIRARMVVGPLALCSRNVPHPRESGPRSSTKPRCEIGGLAPDLSKYRTARVRIWDSLFKQLPPASDVPVGPNKTS